MAAGNVDMADLEEGWATIYQFIVRIRGMLERGEGPSLNIREESMTCMGAIYMCSRRGYAEQLYNRYRSSFEDYITSVVLPDLMQRQGDILLRELERRWHIHMVMVRLLSTIFGYLERFFIPYHDLTRLEDVGIGCFRDLVFSDESRITAYRNELNSLIHRQRHGEKIDRVLLENIKGIFVKLGIAF